MTENAKKVLNFLQKNYGKEFTKHEIVEKIDINMSAVSGSVNGLVSRGLATERRELIQGRFKGEKDTEIRYVKLTEKGKEYDPDEEERRQAEAHLELVAARKKERARLKAERAKLNSVL